MRPLAVDDPEDLDREALLSVALDGRVPVLGERLLDGLAQRRAEVLAILARGRPVYGVSTGMGAQSGVRLSAEEEAEHQGRLLVGRAAGGPPWLDRAEVRALVAVRLRTFLSGDAAVSPGLCARLAGLLEHDVAPAVPRHGSGSAGEIVPLAHAFQVLVGLGAVLDRGTGDRTVRLAAPVLGALGLGRAGVGPKEGIALLAGVPGATALALLRAHEARTLLQHALAVAAAGIAVVRAPRDPYHPLAARGDDLLADVLEHLRDLAGPEPAPRSVQAPVSFRVAGAVAAHALRAAGALEGAVDRALDGVTDSPAHLDGGLVGTAGFHGVDLAGHLDALVAALVHAAEVSVARLHRLLDEEVTGLPRQLTERPGPECGLVAVHKRAVAAAHAARRLALPAALGPVETSGGQEDVQSFAWEAAEQARLALEALREVLACELLAVHRAWLLARRPPPAGVAPLLRAVDLRVPAGLGDRPFGADVEELRAALREGLPTGPAGAGAARR
ncbi:aromatic amino acid lyase [Vallicoccus soli]|uniref:aromatic amino acid lyase n=1 Tax=Vallicoccus soli TaxID=2339232 RepID=UPI001402E99B|nr:aromatic amino acid lyase [Vallicoccus soli]